MQAKQLLTAVVLAAAIPLSANAGSDEKTEDLINALNLQDNRAEQVREILDAYHEQKKQIMELAHDQAKQAKELKKQRLDSVLTDEEMEQLKSIMEQKKEKYRAAHGEGHMKKWKEE